jgi:hypothetical protein
LDWLCAWLERKHQAAYAEVRGEVVAEFERLRELLARRLTIYRRAVTLAGDAASPSFAEVTAERLRAHSDDLQAQLGRITGPDDEEPAHEARIAAKRLRYLLEPLRGHARSAKPAAQRVKELQDVLGELHDCAVLAGEIGGALAQAAAERARAEHDRAWKAEPGEKPPRDPRPGMVATSRLVRARRDELYARLQAEWLEQGHVRWHVPAESVIAELAALVPARGRMRQYRLRRLPELPAGAATVDEGFIMTGPLRERVRRVRVGRRTRCFRVLESEAFAREQEISGRHFSALWPLTAGRRLRARELTVGSTRWRFLRRRGAVVAIAYGGDGVPPWLEALVLRELTGGPDFETPARSRR